MNNENNFFNQNQNNDLNNNFNGQMNGGVPNNGMPINNNFQGMQMNQVNGNYPNNQMNTMNPGMQSNQMNPGYQDNMMYNQVNANGQNNMYNLGINNQVNQVNNGYQNNQNNFVNQPNMMYQQNNQFVQNNNQQKQGTFGGLCVSSVINFIIFTIAVFLFGGLLYSILISVLDLQSEYMILELMEDSVVKEFCTKQIMSALLSACIYSLMYMLSIRYIVKSRLRKKSYSIQNIKSYKIIAIIMSGLMFGIVNSSIVTPIDSTYKKAMESVSSISSYYENENLDKALDSYGNAKMVATGVTLVFSALTIVLSLSVIKKAEAVVNVSVPNNIVNNNYMQNV